MEITIPKKTQENSGQAFRAFENASSSSKPVRVLHYGDSQIEGDRITSLSGIICKRNLAVWE
jgi:hypothetical protein